MLTTKKIHPIKDIENVKFQANRLKEKLQPIVSSVSGFFIGNQKPSHTATERLLWEHVLKNKNMLGFKFISERTSDNKTRFYCKDLDVSIQINNQPKERTNSKRNETEAPSVDFSKKKMIFTEKEVGNDIIAVKAAIKSWILKNYMNSRNGRI